MNIERSRPRKTRELHNHHFDSTIWNDFAFRDDDIVIVDLRQVGHDLDAADRRPAALRRARRTSTSRRCRRGSTCACRRRTVKLPLVEAQTHRRFLKTHLPVDALVFSPKAKYLYIGRDGRDVVWSMLQPPRQRERRLVRGAERHARPRRPADRAAAGRQSRSTSATGWRATAIRSGRSGRTSARWWAIRDLPNVLLLHFDDAEARPAGRDPAHRRRSSRSRSTRTRWPAILEHCSLRLHEGATRPRACRWAARSGTAARETFIHKGVNGRWRDVLSAEDCAALRAVASRELGPECARWLAEGARAASLGKAA